MKTTKEKTLSDKKGYVDSWEIRNEKDTHPSHRTIVYKESDVKQFIKEILSEFRLWRLKEFGIAGMSPKFKKFIQIIKQKAGDLIK